MGQASEIDWRDITEAIPAFLTLMMIPLTFSITNGILFGLGSSFALTLATGKLFRDCRLWWSNASTNSSRGDVGHPVHATQARTGFEDSKESEALLASYQNKQATSSYGLS